MNPASHLKSDHYHIDTPAKMKNSKSGSPGVATQLIQAPQLTQSKAALAEILKKTGSSICNLQFVTT